MQLQVKGLPNQKNREFAKVMKIIDKIFHYFTPKELHGLNEFDGINQEFKAHIIIFTLIFSITIFLLMFILFWIELGFLSSGGVGVLGPALVLIVFLFIYKFYSNKYLFNILFIVVAAMAIPIRTFQFMGHSWILLPWIFSLFLLVGFAINFRVSLPIFVSNLGFTAYAIYYMPEFEGYLRKEFQILSNFVFPGFFFLGSMYIHNYAKNSLVESVKKLEKKDTLRKVIVSLNHEINNPLSIAKANLVRLEKLPQESEQGRLLISSSQKAIERIENLIHKIQDIENLEETSYLGETQMYNLHSDENNNLDNRISSKHT